MLTLNFVYCILLAKDTESNTKEFRSFKIPIIYNPNDTFIEYENLQQSDVEKWIEEYLTTDTVNTIKAQIESNFTKMKTNPIVVNIPPWQTANTAYNGAWPPTIDDVDIL